LPAAAARATVEVAGGAGWAWNDRVWFLAPDGVALLRVDAPGFLSREVAVAAGADAVTVVLTEAPAAVVVTTAPALAQTKWRVDGVHVATGARFEQVLQPGAARIAADHEFYRVEELRVEVAEGRGIERHLELTPVAGALDIRSEPAGARVLLDGADAGVTPVEIAVAGGAHRLQVALDGYQSVEESIVITNRAPMFSRDYRLATPRSEARITVSPPGGTLRVNGVATSLGAAGAVQLAAGRAHRLRYEKPGYVAAAREVTPAADEVAEIAFNLQMEFGEVTVQSSPPADITVDGKPAGAAPQTLRLQALPHRIELTRPGYRAVTAQVTPRAAAPLLIDEVLLPEFDARLAEATPFITAAAGIKMKFFDPRGSRGSFTMGAPRGEKFRRANEFQRPVELTKPFYVGVTEITEAQFAQFQSGAGGAGGGQLPARNVSWLQAAAFCNWLSAQDGLQPAYRLKGGQLQGFDPTADGYRLLSEAEWEWLARVAGRGAFAKFVWGFDTTIPAGSGNFADESAKGRVAQYIPRYNDGFAGAAPVASFAADAAGLYDMAGNVSEWMHDLYILQPPAPGAVARNPFGGDEDGIGQDGGRVIKGANFRTASITGLRSSFREGLSGARDDVGFRIARYLYGKE